MRIEDLRRAVRARGASSIFALSSRPTRGLPEASTVVRPVAGSPGTWEVFYTERGRIFDRHTFSDEDSACRYAYEILITPELPAGEALTPKELDRARDMAGELEAERRRAIRAAGLDPDSGLPISREGPQ